MAWASERLAELVVICSISQFAELFHQAKTETKLTASVLKQDPNTQRVKKNANFNGTTQNMHAFSGDASTSN